MSKKIYIWEDLDLSTYLHDGKIIVIAENLREAKKLAKEVMLSIYLSSDKIDQLDISKPKIIDPSKKIKSSVIHFYSGSD